MNHKEFSIVNHGGTFSCIPSQLLADIRAQESAKRLVARALDEGEVTLKSVGAIAGADEVLRGAVQEVIMTLLNDQFDHSVGDRWYVEDLWEHLVALGVVVGEVPEGWQPTEEDLGRIPVLENEWLWAPSALLSAEWSEYLPEEVVELAEFTDSMLHGEQMWFSSESLERVTAILVKQGCTVSEGIIGSW